MFEDTFKSSLDTVWSRFIGKSHLQECFDTCLGADILIHGKRRHRWHRRPHGIDHLSLSDLMSVLLCPHAFPHEQS